MNATKSNSEVSRFFKKILKSHPRCVDPCFMTGMACVSTDEIEKNRKAGKHKTTLTGFMVMPFQPKLTVFFYNILKPFIEKNYHNKQQRVILSRSDVPQKTGTVVCQGICRKIQEADFVIADVSCPNENVFYELGLAYGMGQSLILVGHNKRPFAQSVAKYLGCPLYLYADLDPLLLSSDAKKGFSGSALAWSSGVTSPIRHETGTSIGFVEILKHSVFGSENDKNLGLPHDPESTPLFTEGDIELDFTTHVKSDIGLAIADLSEDKDLKRSVGNQIQRIEQIKKKIAKRECQIANNQSFKAFKAAVDNAYLLIVRTGKDCHPMAYFWLGYGHARGQNVIPITQLVVSKTTGEEGIQDLAFDIRAQRHMTFSHRKPEQLQGELSKVMRDTIVKDFTVWSRKHFWDKFLGNRGEVSIITGALHVANPVREMVGDWDLRAASELAAYLSNQQYRPRIETPIYQPEFVRLDPIDYIKSIHNDLKLGQKNCVVIASPDVNPLTEIIFGKCYGVPDKDLFKRPSNLAGFVKKYSNAVIVRKRQFRDGNPPEGGKRSAIARAFYVDDETYDQTENKEERGVIGGWIGSHKIESVRKTEILLPYKSQQELDGRQDFDVYGHILIARNPFTPPDAERRYVIVLNGVSGPATFAMTHVLTGGVNDDFTLYSERKFDAKSMTEEILNKVLSQWNNVEEEGKKGLQCIIRVSVAKRAVHTNASPIFDWRLIAGWKCGGEKIVSF
ncbi:MAG: hypothetical protein WCO56_25215 [Verrucomicrobiota bacterium]